ncbi:MAG: CBS domain-containing protein, partial [Balneolaceae bacterium]
MLTEEYINRGFIPLKPSEQISDVLETMKSDAAISLPVVEPTTGKLIGQVTLSQLEEAVDKGAAISSIRFENSPSLYPNQHIFESSTSMLIHE